MQVKMGIMTESLASQVVSKQRVADHGEVFTDEREVNAMLDLVKDETMRIESRFLEPACGTGNFLSAILKRKLDVVSTRYGKSDYDYFRYAMTALTSIYGIDILEDNVVNCRERLLRDLLGAVPAKHKVALPVSFTNSAEYILQCNIIWGDALTLKRVDVDDYITFCEWSPVNGSMLKRRDFTFHGLLEHEGMKDLPLFSDLGEDVFIPQPEKEYPPVFYLGVADAYS